MEYSKVEDMFGDWGPKFRPFIEGKEERFEGKFDKIYDFLKQQSREGRKICPESKNVFRAFKECPYKNLKLIIIGQDPYSFIKNGVYVADGIAMSCRNTGELQPSLKIFYEGIEEDLGIKTGMHPDLTYLANQGILFLNTALTVEEKKPTSHNGIWDPFMDYLFEEVINFYDRGLIYLMLGKNADAAGKAIIPFLHWGITVEHPAASAHRNREWFHEKCFTKIATILKNSNNEQIKWAYEAPVILETT